MSELKFEYYRLHDILSRNAYYNFVVSARSDGKTFSFVEWAYKDFIKNKKTFCYVRRRPKEIEKNTKDFMGNYLNVFPDCPHEFRKEGFMYYIRKKNLNNLPKKDYLAQNPWEVFGYFIALSQQQEYKSTPFPNCNKILYDEFIITSSHKKYLKEECNEFFELEFTIFRDRENCRAFFFANSGFVGNPFFKLYNIRARDMIKNPKFIFRNEKQVILQYYKNGKNLQKRNDSKRAKVLPKEYKSYAFENSFSDIEMEFVEPKSKDLSYTITITDGNTYYDIFKKTGYDNLWVTKNKNLNNKTVCSVNSDKVIMGAPYYNDIKLQCKKYTQRNQVTFSSADVKYDWYDIFI